MSALIEKMAKEVLEASLKSNEEFLKKLAETNKSLEQIAKSQEISKDKANELMHTNPAFQFANFVKAVKTKDKEMIGKLKAHDPNDVQTSADGGILVPTLTASSIYQLIATAGQAVQNCQRIPLSGVNVITLPKKLTGATTYVVSEEASITSTKPTLGSFTLTPYKFATLGAVTNELLMSASIPFGQYLLDLFAQSQASKLDSLVFQDGSTTWEGMFYSTNTYGNSELTSGINANTLTYENLINCSLGVDQNYLVGAKWIMSRSVLALVRGLTDGNLRPIFEPASGVMPATLLGYPILIVENAPTAPTTASKNFIALGNMNNCMLGDVSGIRIDTSNSATIDSDSAFQYDFTGIRMIKHWAFDYEPLAFSTVKTAAA